MREAFARGVVGMISPTWGGKRKRNTYIVSLIYALRVAKGGQNIEHITKSPMSFVKRDVAVPPLTPQLVIVQNVYQHLHRHSIVTPSINQEVY
jgi:hypothetical protein